MKRTKALFVKQFTLNPKFITNDIDLLRTEYDVTTDNVRTSKGISTIFALVKQYFYLLFNIWKFKFVFIWFADYHSFLPVLFAKVFGKKSIICAGGYECTYIPEVNCGVFTNATLKKRARNFCAAFSLKHCSLILPVDESLIENVNTYIYSDTPGKEPLHDGIKHFIPGIKTAFETLHLGYDPEIFKMLPGVQKERSIISAGLIINDDEFRRKGFDLLVEAAKIMTDVKFVLVGLNDEFYEKLSALKLPNLHLDKIVSYERLIEEYSKAKVFAQISMFEGMPSTICEAMMCGCVPVGSNVNGLPKIVDGCGYLIKEKNVKDLCSTLLIALNSIPELEIKAREHIMNIFSIEQRKSKLLKIIDQLLRK